MSKGEWVSTTPSRRRYSSDRGGWFRKSLLFFVPSTAYAVATVQWSMPVNNETFRFVRELGEKVNAVTERDDNGPETEPLMMVVPCPRP